MKKYLKNAVNLLAVLALLSVPVAAQAQGMPSYAHPDNEKITGTVTSFDGRYHLQVRDDRGFIDNVQLHQGTVINPTGLTLAPGMKVTIYGAARGRHFDAAEIDTPYHYVSAVPVYPYPYPYPGPYWRARWWGPGFGFGVGW
jgi:hypothetical protein